MKTASLPPVRIEPAFRRAAEEVLQPGETLTQLVESAVRTAVSARKNQAEFLRRGMQAIEETRLEATGIPAEQVIAGLEARLAAARQSRAR